MRRVSGLRAKAGAEGATEATEQRQSSAASGARMQSAPEFYQRVGERRFGDTSRPVDAAQIANVIGANLFREMTARITDSEIRKAATTPGATVAPERVFRAWAGLLVDDFKRQPNAPADTDAAFQQALGWGEQVLLELRRERPFLYKNVLQTTTDFISKVGAYEPDVLLARELAKRPELGGSSILSEALERCFVPADIHRALAGQVTTMPKVVSSVPAAPPTLLQVRLDDLGILDAVLSADSSYPADIAKLRQQLGLTRTAPGLQLNLRDQIDGPLELRETFSRVAASLTTGVDQAARELILVLARLQSSPEVTMAVKKVAFLQIDATMRRLTKEAAATGKQSPTFASLAQALVELRAKFESEIAAAAASRTDPVMPKMLRDSVDALIKDVFKVTGDAHFAAEHMAVAKDPGAIMLRKVLDTPARDALVSKALAKASGQAERAAQIALIADKTKREAELAKLLAADKDFQPPPEAAALLLSWPADVPRPTTEEAAKAARVKDLEIFGPNNLNELIEQGKGEAEIFGELLRLGGQGHFHVGPDEKVDSAIDKIIRGDAKPEAKPWFGDETLTPLLASPAIAALPAQMRAGANDDAVRKSIIRAIRTQNGQLIHDEKGLRVLLRHPDPKCRVKLQTVLEALAHTDKTPDPTMPGRTLSAVEAGVNVLFAYRVLVECSIGLGAAADDEIRAAGRDLMKRSGIACLAPYASMSHEENLELLLAKSTASVRPDGPHYLPMLDRLDLPETALTSIAGRDDLNKFPPAVLFELFTRAVEDKSVPLETVATFAIAATTLRAEGSNDVHATNVWATFNDLATRKYDRKLGSLILAGMSAQTNVDVVFRAAASLAAEGKLFDADEVANAVMARDPASTQTLVNELGAQAPTFFEALSVETAAKLLHRVVKGLESATDASVLDLTGPCLKRLAELAAAGHQPGAEITAALEGILMNAVIRVAKNPLETAALVQIFADAQIMGVDVEKVIKSIMTDDKAKTAQALTLAQLAAVRFELARLMPNSDVADLRAAIPGARLDVGPYMAAFDLAEHRALPEDVLQSLFRSAIGWAADQKAFGRVVAFRKRLADAGHQDRLAVFDTALDAAMKDKPDVWAAVPEARALAAIGKLEELRPEIVELAAGGEEAGERARALADRVAASTPYAAELVPQVLSALRREVRAMRPSLDDIHVGLEVPENPEAAGQKAAPEIPTKNVYGVPVQLFQGDTSHGRVPDAVPFTETEVGVYNMNELNKALNSDAPFVVVLGDPGTSKTHTAKFLAYQSGSPLVELDGGPERRADEAAGAWGRDKHGMLAFTVAEELEIFTKGGYIVDDEFKSSRRFILEQRGEQAQRFNKKIVMRTSATETVERHPQTKIICIANFTEEEIPREIMEVAKIVYFRPLPIDAQSKIARNNAPSLDTAELDLLGKMQVTVEVQNKHENFGKAIALSVRNLNRAAKRAEKFRGNPELASARAARESYLDGVLNPLVKAKLAEAFKLVFGVTPEETLPDPASIEIKHGPRSVSIGEATVDHGPNKPVHPGKLTAYTGGVEVPYILGDRERIELEALAKAMQMKESTLYVTEPESGFGAMVEAMSALTGLELVPKDMTSQITVTDIFGAMSTRAIDDRNFETVFEPGFINKLNKANKGGIVLLTNVDRLKDGVRTQLHRMLADRKIPGEDGRLVDMHPNLHIVMTTSASEHRKLGLAFQNRITQRHLKAKTEAEVTERLVAIGEKLKIPALMVEDMVRFQTMWTKMCGGLIAKYVPKDHLPVPGMTRLITWLGDLAKVMNGANGTSGDLSAQMRETLIQGGLTHYAVPDSREFDADGNPKKPDLDLLREILTAMADGKEDEVLKLNGNIVTLPAAAPTP